MIDRFGRQISYLRISVTDRCNLRCRYCMPQEGVPLLKHSEIMTLEEITEVARCAVDMGVTKVRLTGGEPLVRRGILKLVETIGQIAGINDFAMTTNGTLLGQYARDLAQAGLHRINVSIDTVDAEKYRNLTRGGSLKACLDGIQAAQQAGLTPIKLNCVAGEYTTEADVKAVQEFGREQQLEVRIIRQMVFETGSFEVVQGGSGGDCAHCNRIRLSSDGKIRPCLFSDICFDVRQLGARSAITQAISAKPQAGGPCNYNMMYRIGG